MAMAIDRINHAYLQANCKKATINNTQQSVSFGYKAPIPRRRTSSLRALMIQIQRIFSRPKRAHRNFGLNNTGI